MSVEHGILPGSEMHRFPIEWYLKNGLAHIDSLIISGIHGDERYTLAPVRETIEAQKRYLNGMLFIPELIPQAGFQNTRENGQGLDGNRYAYEGTPAVEVSSLMRFVSQRVAQHRKMRIAATIHGDNEVDGVYVYINGNLPPGHAIDLFRDDMNILGVPLFSGTDDRADPTLGNYVQDGIVVDIDGEGSIETWLTLYAQTIICAELIKGLSQHLQLAVVNSITNRFILGI